MYLRIKALVVFHIHIISNILEIWGRFMSDSSLLILLGPFWDWHNEPLSVKAFSFSKVIQLIEWRVTV